MARIKTELPQWFLELEYSKLKQLLENIRKPRDKALLMTIYACYGRVGEVVKGWVDGSPNTYSRPLTTNNIDKKTIISDDGKAEKFVVISPYTLKHHEQRSSYISVKRELWLAKTILEWRRKIRLEFGDGVLFFGANRQPLSSRTVNNMFEKYIAKPLGLRSQNVHLMRSWRSTHGSRGNFTKDGKPYPIEAQMLEGGWRSTYTLMKHYNKAKTMDYLKQR